MVRNRRFILGLVIVLGLAAWNVYGFATHRARGSLHDRGHRVTQVWELPPEERAEFEQLARQRAPAAVAPGDFACPTGMIAIPGTVDVPAFCVDARTPTNAEVAACIASGKCAQPEPGSECDLVRSAPPEEPASCFDREIEEAYCASTGRRVASSDEHDRARRLRQGTGWLLCALTP